MGHRLSVSGKDFATYKKGGFIFDKEYDQYPLKGNALNRELKKLMLDLINVLINTRIMENEIQTCL